MSKHSRTPWNITHVRPWPNCPGVHDFKIKSNHGRSVARIDALPDWEEMQANAAHIVHCVNSYDEIMKQFNRVANKIDALGTGNSDSRGCNDLLDDLYDIYNIATEAIAKAEEGEIQEQDA